MVQTHKAASKLRWTTGAGALASGAAQASRGGLLRYVPRLRETASPGPVQSTVGGAALSFILFFFAIVGIGGSGHVGSQGVDPDWLARYHRTWLEARKHTCNDWIDAHVAWCPPAAEVSEDQSSGMHRRWPRGRIATWTPVFKVGAVAAPQVQAVG